VPTDSTNAAPGAAGSGPEPAGGTSQKKKKKDKVRSAWISFVGRIVAQVVGAVVSIVLAIFFLQRVQRDDPKPTAPVADQVGNPANRPAAMTKRCAMC
jgi:hypothetical protein